VALLADLIHNFGDALTAIPLGLAFFFRSLRGERFAGLAVVLAIFISALVALGQTVERFAENVKTLFPGLSGMGGTGLEPVTPSLSSPKPWSTTVPPIGQRA
jgi:divalent metal cation (Fe/Co/Zn/Cd) transporter